MNYFTIEEGMAGKAAFITGGTAGIGKACVRIFCAAGINVVTVGRSVQKGEALAEEINAENRGICIFRPLDVTDLEGLEKMIDLTADTFGRLDVLVNCAGVFPSPKPIDEIDYKMYSEVFTTNFTPYFMGCKYALPYLRKTRGSIVNIGSVVATTGGTQCEAYVATKGAIETFTRSLAIDEAAYGVRVNEVKPGHIETEIFEQLVERQPEGGRAAYKQYFDRVQCLGRGGLPDEVAYAVLFLASTWASFITGAELLVTGGYELGEGEKTIL